MLTHIDLFSGIGGFALACKWAGIQTVQFVEIDKFCQKVLAKNFPGIPIHDDIQSFKYSTHNSTINVIPFLLTGGFPCQPFSCAGKRRGKEDDRYLWPQMLRVVSEAKPRWVIGENVSGFINMGLDDCISDLENQGYEVQAFVIPACAVGAPHRRDRVWIVAQNTINGIDGGKKAAGDKSIIGVPSSAIRVWDGTDCHAADTDRFNGDDAGYGAGEVSQLQEAEVFRGNTSNSPSAGLPELQKGEFGKPLSDAERNPWAENWPEVAQRFCKLDDGLPDRLARPDRNKNRVQKLKALGNAIVPQIAFELIRAILEVEKINA